MPEAGAKCFQAGQWDTSTLEISIVHPGAIYIVITDTCLRDVVSNCGMRRLSTSLRNNRSYPYLQSTGDQAPPSGFRSARGLSEVQKGHSTLIADGKLLVFVDGYIQEILTRAAARNDEPSPVVHPDLDSSIVVNISVPAWKRLCSYDFPSHEVISLVEAIFTNRDEVKVVCGLRGGDAQTVIDVIHKVCLAILPP